MEIIIAAASSLRIDIMLIGAYSRDYWKNHFQIKAAIRSTEDIDFACQILRWNEYEDLFNLLLNQGEFTRDRQQSHRLYFRNEFAVDIIPIGGIADENGNIEWPPDFDSSLCVLGYDAAKNDSEAISIGTCRIKIIKPYWLALLKLQAYIETPSRKKDLQDFYFLVNYYCDFIDEDERIYKHESIDADILNINDFDIRIAAAALIARDCLRSSRSSASRVIKKIVEYNRNHSLSAALVATIPMLHEDIAERILLAMSQELDSFR